jgi:uncharacterized protein (TIGR02186 family)
VTAPACAAAIAVTTLLLQVYPAAAERLIATIAPSRLSISSSYSGSTIVVFGGIEVEDEPERPYDVVVTVTGPRQTLVTRRKERVAGIWINQDSRTFPDLPSFLGVFANRPFDAIADTDVLRRERIGLKNAVLADSDTYGKDPYLTNLLSIRVAENLYVEQPRAVTFLSATMFRAAFRLPENVPTGAYGVDLILLSDGAPLARASSKLHVAKVGVEELVVTAAAEHSLIYGLATMAMALCTGWLASIAFRRD